MPRTNGFGNRTAAKSRSSLAHTNARTSSCEAAKLAKASLREGATRGSILLGALILKGALTGGSSIFTNQRPASPGVAALRLNLRCSRARIAGCFMASRYTRFALARWSRHSATLHELVSARQRPCVSTKSATSARASRSAASSCSFKSWMSHALMFTLHTV